MLHSLEQAHAQAAPPPLAATPAEPDSEWFRDRILSMWNAMCTASQAKPDTFLLVYWTRSIRVLGGRYVTACKSEGRRRG